MLIAHDEDHNNTIQVYSVTVMTHVIALEAGQSSLGTFEPITPVMWPLNVTALSIQEMVSDIWDLGIILTSTVAHR